MGYRSQNIGRASSPSCVVPRWCARTTVHLTRRTRCPSPARRGKEGGRRMAGLFGLVTPPDACARSRLQRAQSHLGHEPTLATSRGAVGCIVFPYAHSSLYRLDPAQRHIGMPSWSGRFCWLTRSPGLQAAALQCSTKHSRRSCTTCGSTGSLCVPITASIISHGGASRQSISAELDVDVTSLSTLVTPTLRMAHPPRIHPACLP